MVGKIMVNQLKALFCGLLIVGATGVALGNIQLKIGSLTVDPSAVSSASCIQVPIFINDPDLNRDMLDLTFTVEITGDTGIITGGIAADMLVGNAFTNGSLAGIQNLGVNLSNNNSGTGAPNCANPSFIFNQLTLGQGPGADFFGGNMNANWFINNNQGALGRKQGFVINLAAQIMGTTVLNQDLLVGVLVIPVNASPGPSQLVVTATPNAVVVDANVYTYDDGTRDADGNRVPVSEALDLSPGPGIINIFQPEDCTSATITDNTFRGPAEDRNDRGGPVNIDYLDPMAGGVGGEIVFTMPHSANVDQITITGDDGFNTTIPATGTQTMLTINTQGDGSPATGQSTINYTITYEIEFPTASGTFVGGAPCAIDVNWNPATCTIVFDTIPVFGGNTNGDVTLTNVTWNGVRFGNVTGPNALNVDLVVPTSVAGTTLTFDDAFTIVSIDNTDVGSYPVTGIGPGVGNNANCSVFLGLMCPTSDINCPALPQVTIGGMLTIPLVGTNVADWDITYNGVTTNVPGNTPNFVVSPIVGTVAGQTVTVTANGFGPTGTPCSDTDVCTLDFVAPVCVDTQQVPDTMVMPVDVGTIINLTLITTGAISATINNVPMVASVGTPGVDDMITWTAMHTAVTDTVVTALISNPENPAETNQCDWIIDINCEDPTILSVAPVGQTGIIITGTVGCTYDVRITWAGMCQLVPITIGMDGTGTDNVFVIPADAIIEVGQLGQLPLNDCGAGMPTDEVRTVPTLGEWALIAFVLLLMTAGVFYIRRNRLA